MRITDKFPQTLAKLSLNFGFGGKNVGNSMIEDEIILMIWIDWTYIKIGLSKGIQLIIIK